MGALAPTVFVRVFESLATKSVQLTRAFSTRILRPCKVLSAVFSKARAASSSSYGPGEWDQESVWAWSRQGGLSEERTHLVLHERVGPIGGAVTQDFDAKHLSVWCEVLTQALLVRITRDLRHKQACLLRKFALWDLHQGGGEAKERTGSVYLGFDPS